ncbi:MAG: hypothetical protein ACJ75I_11995 [Solirubrobacterales bacterium]
MISAGTPNGRGTDSIQRSRSGLVRRASAWVPGMEPSWTSLADLEDAPGVRWVDVHHAELHTARALGALNRVCDGMLTQRMARDLATPRRFPAAGSYGSTQIRMTAGFLVRHLQAAADGSQAEPVVSVLKPVQLLIGQGWVLSAWLPSRPFRGSSGALTADCDGDDPDRLYLAVAASWPSSGGDTSEDLADLIRRELEVASGHRTRAI